MPKKITRMRVKVKKWRRPRSVRYRAVYKRGKLRRIILKNPERFTPSERERILSRLSRKLPRRR